MTTMLVRSRQLRECAPRPSGRELLHRREDDPARWPPGQQRAQLLAVFRLLRRLASTAPARRMKVWNSWPSRSLRSVTTTSVGFCISGCCISLPAKHTIEMLLPEPCVCQTMPPLREPGTTSLAIGGAILLRLARGTAAAVAAITVGPHRLAHRMELVIAGDLLDQPVVALLEQNEIAQVVQQQLRREEAAHHLLQLEFQQRPVVLVAQSCATA